MLIPLLKGWNPPLATLYRFSGGGLEFMLASSLAMSRSSQIFLAFWTTGYWLPSHLAFKCEPSMFIQFCLVVIVRIVNDKFECGL